VTVPELPVVILVKNLKDIRRNKRKVLSVFTRHLLLKISSKSILYISLKGRETLQSNIKYIYIATYRNKEEAIVSKNYESTREQKKTSTV
jgi:hypothetical protein